jgi:hypothetical protein
MRQLVRGGFSLGVAYKILKNWDVDESAIPMVEAEESSDSGE